MRGGQFSEVCRASLRTAVCAISILVMPGRQRVYACRQSHRKCMGMALGIGDKPGDKPGKHISKHCGMI